jgi:hypothetical protein
VFFQAIVESKRYRPPQNKKHRIREIDYPIKKSSPMQGAFFKP